MESPSGKPIEADGWAVAARRGAVRLYGQCQRAPKPRVAFAPLRANNDRVPHDAHPPPKYSSRFNHMTRIDLPVGRSPWELRVRPECLLTPRRAAEPAPMSDVAGAVRDALERPLRFEPLRRALTPDDRVTIVVDEAL